MTKARTPDRDAPASRDDRLSAALRANLARRKAQARARAEQQEGNGHGPDQAPESEE
ncbi:MAG: hypothetical protein ACK5LJ_02010 [Paracoccus sp. (in: a-proteobacteria)]